MTDAGAPPCAADAEWTWSTSDVAPRERLSYWVEAVCEAFFELRVDSRAGDAFEGAAHMRPLGPLGMIFMELGDQHIERTAAQISRSRSEQYQLIQYRNQAGLVTQSGREAWVDPGGFTLVDSRQPFTIDNSAGLDALSIALPADWVEGWLPRPEEALARAFKAGAGWTGILSELLRRLRPERDGGLTLPGAVGAEQIGSLLALTLNQEPAVDERPSVGMLLRLRDTIKGGCHEAMLSPEKVAEHHGISVKTVHHALAAGGTSFGAELNAARLEGAHRMLADSRFRRLQVADIAQRWGFASASHFARQFRDRFECSPTGFRASLHS